MFSIVIPLYNKAESVERALRSIFSQSIENYEIIVVDDGSTDGCDNIVETLNNRRVKLIRQNHGGVSKARNRGIVESHGEWVTFLDADDEWKPDFLATCLALQTTFPDADVVATAYERERKGESSAIILRRMKEIGNILLDNYFEVAACSDPPFCTISVAVRRKALLDIGGFNETIGQGEDLLLWANLATHHKIAYSTQSQAIFHTGETSSLGRPKRIPPDNDVVGHSLESLYKNNTTIPGLREYVATWHKMRASMFLRLPHYSNQCRIEIAKARHLQKNPKLLLYYILLLLPYRLRMALLARQS